MREGKKPDPIGAWKHERWDVVLLVLVVQAGASALGWWGLTHHARATLAGAPAGVYSALVSGSATTWAVSIVMTTLACTILFFRHDRRMRDANARLESEVRERVTHAIRARDAMIFGLAKLADCRDTDTGLHLDRISTYATLLAQAVRAKHPEIDDTWITRLGLAASLHDIGKVGIPDSVLLKPGPLTADERVLIEQHPVIGARTLRAIADRMVDDPLVEMAHDIALGHHERWDGSGYPARASGAETPLAARIVALADVYDALVCDRVYKRAFSHEKAKSIIMEGRATQFDPEIVDAFLSIDEAFQHASASLAENPSTERLAAA